MKLGNDTKYVHVWYEGYDGLSAIINRVKVPDDPNVIFSNFLVSPSITTKNVGETNASLPGTWYQLKILHGLALPSVTKETCKAICDKVRNATWSDERIGNVVIYKLDNTSVDLRANSQHRIYSTLHNEENNLRCEIAMCTTARYLFEEGENGRILNGHRVRCVYRGFNLSLKTPGDHYEIGTNPLDRDQF